MSRGRGCTVLRSARPKGSSCMLGSCRRCWLEGRNLSRSIHRYQCSRSLGCGFRPTVRDTITYMGRLQSQPCRRRHGRRQCCSSLCYPCTGCRPPCTRLNPCSLGVTSHSLRELDLLTIVLSYIPTIVDPMGSVARLTGASEPAAVVVVI